jgi:hypothetical protein
MAEAAKRKETAKQKALREFALTRSCNAAIAANDNSRPMAQAALLINGAAASAIIAFLTKDRIDPALLKVIPWSLGFYAAGVIFGSLAMYFMTESLDMWNCFWELIARGEPKADIEEEREKAEKWWGYVVRCFFVSIGCFVIGSIIFACGIWRVLPTPPH